MSNNRVQFSGGAVTSALLALATALSIVAKPASAEKLPVFELGIGPGAIYQNYYPGTKQTRVFPFPAIIPIYRGEVIKSDDQGVRAELRKDDRLKLDLSLDFNLAIDSDEIDLRQGMPDLPNLLQIGPSLQYTFARDDNEEWLLRVPFRAVFGFDDEAETAGFTFSPDVTYLREMRFLNEPWRLGLSLGPQFGSAKYNDVYYGVEDEFATADRPAFSSEDGLYSTRFLVTFTSKTPKRITSWFLRVEHLSGAVIEDSPLVETDTSFTAGFIYSYMVFKSKKFVDR